MQHFFSENVCAKCASVLLLIEKRNSARFLWLVLKTRPHLHRISHNKHPSLLQNWCGLVQVRVMLAAWHLELDKRPSFSLFSRQRPYHVEYTSSRPITEVKQHWARIVLGWETAWELLVLLAFCTFPFSPPSVKAWNWCRLLVLNGWKKIKRVELEIVFRSSQIFSGHVLSR